jgi:alkanesulfonate monooxygenase SsuD/methylene tetrahydromethanopterin reductase-like flavin-dependent oxidoreductase (luciferase family)
MCDRAGIDALWARDGFAAAGDLARLDAWPALTLARGETSRVRLGAMLHVALRPEALVASMAAELDAAAGGRLELGFIGPEPADRSAADYAARVRAHLESGGAAATRSRPPFWIEVRRGDDLAASVEIADGVLLAADDVGDLGTLVDLVKGACAGAGRAPSMLGIGVELPVSIGRTSAEARARADAEPLFRVVGHPAERGIFGTLEQCQDRVIALAHLGVTELRAILPNSADVHDVIAQLTAIAVGTVHVLRPGAPRSRAPDPPEGWGGRTPGLP